MSQQPKHVDPEPAAQPVRTALVLGGGVAGIAAAVRLADAGVTVTLIEARRRLGGRATSFEDQKTGREIDNCQHVVMRCCTWLLDLYGRLGVLDEITWHRRMIFIDGRGRRDTMCGDDLPAPAHLTASLLGMKSLTLADKFSIARAMSAMLRLPRKNRWLHHGTSFEQWLARTGPTRGAIKKFWDPVVISACNQTQDKVAADYALQVFQDGFLCNSDAYEMGVSDVPLARLYDPAQQAIVQSGGSVVTGVRVTELHADGGAVTGVSLSNGHIMQADVVVSALPFEALDKLCPAAWKERDSRLAGLSRIGFSPIIGVHLWYDRPGGIDPMGLPHCVLTESPVQWIFNKGVDNKPGPTQGMQHLHGVISAAHDLVDVPGEQIAQTADDELQRLVFGQVGHVRPELQSHRVVKEKRATFSVEPGVDAYRPTTGAGAMRRLFLAGDWCDTGWPATMEGACRAGYRAADAAMGRQVESIKELPDSALFRALNW